MQHNHMKVDWKVFLYASIAVGLISLVFGFLAAWILSYFGLNLLPMELGR